MSDDKPHPNVTPEGVPMCCKDECPQYDGKRCKLLGLRPDGLCEPAVVAMAAEVKRLREQNSKLQTALSRARWDRPKAMYGGPPLLDDGEEWA